jgi:hypothetical protein
MAARRILRFERRGASPGARGHRPPPLQAGPSGEKPAAGVEGSTPGPPHGLRRLTAAILAVGFLSALAIFILAGPPAENPLGYEPLDTKKYVHDLQLYGGTANVLADEFRTWFARLWQGRNLAYTVAVLTVLLVLAVRFFATLPPLPEDETEIEVRPPGRGP